MKLRYLGLIGLAALSLHQSALPIFSSRISKVMQLGVQPMSKVSLLLQSKIECGTRSSARVDAQSKNQNSLFKSDSNTAESKNKEEQRLINSLCKWWLVGTAVFVLFSAPHGSGCPD